MKSVMVLMGENRGALSAVRSLGKRGIPVFVGGTRLLSRSLYSRYCKKGFVYPSPHFGMEKMHKVILKNVKKLRPDVLLPFGTVTTSIVLNNQDEYKKYCKIITSVSQERFRVMNDKESLIKEAMKFGCDVPKTYFPENISELQSISKKLNYPVLIKPRLSSGGRGIVKAFSPEELVKLYRHTIIQKKKLDFNPEKPIIQEFIIGQRYTVPVIFVKGKEIASLVFKNCRHYPIYGSPTLNKTVINEKVRNDMVNLFKKFKWNGAANAQCIVDVRDNITKMFEINPSLWACTGSTIAAGIDVPYIMYKMALGDPLGVINDYKANQDFRWILFGDIAYFLKSENKLSICHDFFKFSNTKTDIDLKDPLPHIAQIFDLIVNKQIV